MIFRFFLGILFLLLAHPRPGLCKEILIVLSDRIMPYQQAAEGIQDYLTDLHVSQKAINPYLTSRLDLESGQLDLTWIRQAIQTNNPQVIIAIGTKALKLTKTATSLPIVYVMTPDPAAVLADSVNVTGVMLQVAPAEIMKAIATVFPKRKKLGVLYDPAHSNELIHQAASSASPFALVPIPVFSAGDVPAVLFRAKGSIDALWLIPDQTIMTSRAIEAFVNFSFDNQVPVIAFAKKYLNQGVTMSVSANPFNMGKDAAALAVEILQGVKVSDLPPRYTQQIDIEQNRKVMNKINFKAWSGEEKQ
jgi:putative ABC transport system substrate-binding protein